MYEFVDVTEQPSGDGLPAEALKFNGRYIEDVINGYRTLYTSGRECLSSEITNIEIGASDGSRYQRRRYPAREIKVGYQLIADDANDFREKYNALNAILSTEQAELIFHDEEDKFFTGTWTGGDDVEPGINSITSELTFYCADPFKYSTIVHEVAPTLDDGNTFGVDYHGTYKAYPVLEATMKSDNGFVGYVDENEHILQFGNVEEVDGKNYESSKQERLLTIDNFISTSDNVGGTEAMHPSYGMNGTLKYENWVFKHAAGSADFLTLNTVGSRTSPICNGGLRTVNVPADSQGNVGAKNFYSWFYVQFWASVLGQTGEMSIGYLTSDNKLIAGVNFVKTDCTGNTGYYEIWANGKALKKFYFQTNHIRSQNPFYWNWGCCDIRKDGSKLTFFYSGSYPSYTIPEIKDMVCKKVQVSFKEYSGAGSNFRLDQMGIKTLDFYKTKVEYWKDTPNKFSKNDTLSVDCKTGEVIKRGLPNPGLGALGNDWESFCLHPGNNQIKCVYSSFATHPDFMMKYREVYL